MQEFRTDFNLSGQIYSSKLAVGDFDGDGRDDIVISDDYGSFHIFALHDTSFIELWISDPLNPPMGGIKWLDVIEGGLREGQVFVLDTSDRLHRFSYDGYVFGETDRWDISIEGNFIDALAYIHPDSGNFRFVYLTLLPGQHFNVTGMELIGDSLTQFLNAGVEAPLVALPGFDLIGGGSYPVLMMVLGKAGESGDDEMIFTLEAVNESGKIIEQVELTGLQPTEETITEAAIDGQGRISAIGFALSEEPGFLDMRLWSEVDGEYAEGGDRNTLVAHRGMKTGDIDGDSELEFVMVGLDGFIRILGDETLEFIFNGERVFPELPSLILLGEVYQDAAFMRKLGIEINDHGNSVELARGEISVLFNDGGADGESENGSADLFLIDAYGRRLFPLGRTCIALGYGIRYRSDTGLVEVSS